MEKHYRDASNLNTHIALHKRFSTNAYTLQRRVFDRLELPTEARVLELGCGPGLLWRENLDRSPEGWHVTLTDASPGMLGEAKSYLGTDSRFAFRADYLPSTTVAQSAAEKTTEVEFHERAAALERILARDLASRGEIRISKQTGMFVARR